MRTLVDKLKVEDVKLNEELEDLHGDPDKMSTVFEKRIEYDLYKRFLRNDSQQQHTKLPFPIQLDISA
ncbi:MAG: hypothetical protein WA941_21025 [Nitrososphaeraceae archaeon]